MQVSSASGRDPHEPFDATGLIRIRVLSANSAHRESSNRHATSSSVAKIVSIASRTAFGSNPPAPKLVFGLSFELTPSPAKAVADQALEVAGEPETSCQFHAVIGSFEVRSLGIDGTIDRT